MKTRYFLISYHFTSGGMFNGHGFGQLSLKVENSKSNFPNQKLTEKQISDHVERNCDVSNVKPVILNIQEISYDEYCDFGVKANES